MASQDNGLLPGRHQANMWTDAGILLIGPLVTNFSEILIAIYTFSFMKMHLKMSSAKWRPFCRGLNVLMELISKQSSINIDSESNSPILSGLVWSKSALVDHRQPDRKYTIECAYYLIALCFVSVIYEVLVDYLIDLYIYIYIYLTLIVQGRGGIDFLGACKAAKEFWENFC